MDASLDVPAVVPDVVAVLTVSPAGGAANRRACGIVVRAAAGAVAVSGLSGEEDLELANMAATRIAED